jgi:hypothetical protein
VKETHYTRVVFISRTLFFVPAAQTAWKNVNIIRETAVLRLKTLQTQDIVENIRGPLVKSSTKVHAVQHSAQTPLNRVTLFLLLFEAEGFGLPCTAWAGSGLLVKSRLIRIRADEGARERTRSFKKELVLAAAGRDIPL